MKCCSSGELRAYLDGELTALENDQIREHLEFCPDCACALSRLRQTDSVLVSALTGYAQELSKSPVDADRAWSRFSHAATTAMGCSGPIAATSPVQSTTLMKGWVSFLKTYRKGIATVAAVAALAVAFSFTPVRQAAAGFLTIFRVERVQTLTLDPNDMTKIFSALQAGNAKVDLRNLGKIEVTGREAQSETTREALLKSADFKVKLPAAQPRGYRVPTYFAREAVTVKFTFNVQNINKVLKSLGSDKLFPQSVDGKTVALVLPPQAIVQYLTEDNGKGYITITQSRGPELQVPPGVDMEAIREALLAVPILPENLRTQLASIRDWQRTAIIPNVKGSSTEVMVGNDRGVFFSPGGNSTPGGSPTPGRHSLLVWPSDGVITMIGSNLSPEESLALAASLK